MRLWFFGQRTCCAVFTAALAASAASLLAISVASAADQTVTLTVSSKACLLDWARKVRPRGAASASQMQASDDAHMKRLAVECAAAFAQPGLPKALVGVPTIPAIVKAKKGFPGGTSNEITIDAGVFAKGDPGGGNLEDVLILFLRQPDRTAAKPAPEKAATQAIAEMFKTLDPKSAKLFVSTQHERSYRQWMKAMPDGGLPVATYRLGRQNQ